MKISVNKVVTILWLAYFTLIFTSPFPVSNPGLSAIILLVILFFTADKYIKNRTLALLTQLLTSAIFIVVNMPPINLVINTLKNDFTTLVLGNLDRVSTFFSAIYCVILAFIFTYVFLKKTRRVAVVIGTFLGAILITWAIIYVGFVSKVHVGIFMVMGFYILSNLNSEKDLSGKSKYQKNNYVTLAIILMVTLGLSMDYQVAGFGDIKATIESLPEFGSGGSRTSGYGTDDEELGHPMELDETPVLKITADQNHYLKGHFRYIYNGRGWYGGQIFHPTSYSIDNLPIKQKEAIDYTTVKGEVEVLRGQYDVIFTPGNTKKVKVDGITHLYHSSYRELEIKDPVEYLGTGDSYKYYSKVPNWSEDFLSNQPRPDKRKRLALELPENYQDGPVSDLVDDILEGVEGPYNKAKTIENYLRLHYNYSLEVEPPNQGKDFVEDFLFNQQQGYCVHFSSAFVIMARLADIESRWVSGFAQGTPDGDSYIIKQKHAHSWPEIYIDNAGWVAFEPTPGFRNNVIVSSETEREHVQHEQGLAELYAGDWDEEGQRGEISLEESDRYNGISIFYPLIFLLLGAALSAIISIKKLFKENKLTNELFVIKNYHTFLKRLDLFKVSRAPSETPLEYYNRIKVYAWVPKEVALYLTNKFIEVHYGKAKANDKVRTKLLAGRKSISFFSLLKSKLVGRLK
ncbi:transglutaminase domain-containing protein [Proteinivorax tanatarense]|uniref:Transglutaminase domain-containing protein n=1 Tax=Proteinivorax tanatarense TaxID=1260629 RepID=A0AAU7VKI8_9FIRM